MRRVWFGERIAAPGPSRRPHDERRQTTHGGWCSWSVSAAAARACSPAILGQLGFHVPQPEVTADDTNPRGFGEPRWVVDFHTRLLRARDVTVNDARPTAWETTNAAATTPPRGPS